MKEESILDEIIHKANKLKQKTSRKIYLLNQAREAYNLTEKRQFAERHIENLRSTKIIPMGVSTINNMLTLSRLFLPKTRERPLSLAVAAYIPCGRGYLD